MYLRKLLLAFLIISLPSMPRVMAQGWQWAKSTGGSGNERAAAMASDGAGNVYSVGYFSSASITFGFYPLNNTASGFNDVLLVKYDPSGTVLWAVSAGGSDEDYATSVATDPWGNVYIGGYFYGSSMIIGTDTLSNVGSVDSADMFIAKYDQLGNFLWARRAGGILDDYINSIKTDISGNIIVTGSFQSPYLAFGTDTVRNPIATVDRFFVIKYDSVGNYVWSTGAGGVGYDFGYAVTTDPGNNIFVTGAFGSTNITFGSTVLTNSSSVNDIFVVKYDSMGVVQWAKSAMGTGNDVPTAAGADVYGNVYVAGRYSSATLAFGSTTLTNAGATGYDIFLTKYDYAGNVLWAKSNGGSADDIVHALAIDDSSYVVLAGNFVSPTLHFGGSTLSYDGTGISALFIAKYDSLGHALWGATTGPGHSDANGVAVTIPGKIYLAGDYSDTTFWFGNDTVQNVIHTGTLDMFVAKFNEGPLSVPVVTAKSNMAVYPNPNNGMMTVSFGEPGYENIGIYDCLGRLIYQAPISKNETSVKINATDLSDGVYMLRTIHNGASESLPFVIRR